MNIFKKLPVLQKATLAARKTDADSHIGVISTEAKKGKIRVTRIRHEGKKCIVTPLTDYIDIDDAIKFLEGFNCVS